jgi:hypothetical protein
MGLIRTIKMKLLSLSSFVLMLLTLAFSSCKKTCTIPTDNVNKGWIEQNVQVHAKSSYLTNQMKGNYIVTGSSPLANFFQMSIDEGAIKPVNYSSYTILCYPILTSCNAQFEREVIFDAINEAVLYKIIVTECNECEEERFSENYVLVPKFPSKFKVYYDIQRVNAD